MKTLIRSSLLLTALASSCIFAASPAELQGRRVPDGTMVDRVIHVTPATTSINVSYGEVVMLIMPDGQPITWKFDGVASSFPLSRLEEPSAIAGAGAPRRSHDVRVNVNQADNPLNVNGE